MYVWQTYSAYVEDRQYVCVRQSITIYSQGLITEKNMASIDTTRDYRDIVVFNWEWEENAVSLINVSI